jgi:hypothetical protein
MNLGDLETRRYFLVVGVFLAVLFALLGPEGSTELGPALRLLQWVAQVGIPLVLLIVSHLVLSRLSAFDRLGPWAKLSISGVVGGLLFTPSALALDFLFGVDDWGAVQGPRDVGTLLVDEALAVVFPVTLVWVGINAPRVLGLNFSQSMARPPTKESPEATAEPGAQSTSPFLSLLPPAVGRDIIYIMSELHYLRVVTTQGSTLVLYNLRDAIDELPAGSGLQPHRSYWVALGHLLGLSRRDGRPYLKMSDDSLIPVSRRRLNEVRSMLTGA